MDPKGLRGRTVGMVALLATLSASHLSGQAVIRDFSYDNLRPSAIQLDLGMLNASQLEGTMVGGLRLDYGNIAPKVRVLLGISYFRAPLDEETTTRYEQRIRDILQGDTTGVIVDVGEIFWSNLAFDMDFQYIIPQGKIVTTYIGAGISVQLRNGKGTAIDGTFVEDALDQLAAAVNISIGVEGRVSGRWYVTGDARGALSLGLATISARGGVMYRWGGGPGGGGAAKP